MAAAAGASVSAMEPRAPTNEIERLWAKLRSVTSARIGLPRTGSSVATSEQLAFRLAHARAKDAVQARIDPAALLAALRSRALDAVAVASMAPDRRGYLARPDLGRRLAEESRDALAAAAHGHDIAFVLADGLSAQAVAVHALPLIDEAAPLLRREGWTIGPVAVVEQGRVAIGDEIGELLDAALVAVLIGERPGLTSPTSLGVYLTWSPKIGRSDAERNCLSNIRPEGMSYGEAASRLFYLCREARARRATGVGLKDEFKADAIEPR
jgi:ethanolamine ammonia-lyase small subunit